MKEHEALIHWSIHDSLLISCACKTDAKQWKLFNQSFDDWVAYRVVECITLTLKYHLKLILEHRLHKTLKRVEQTVMLREPAILEEERHLCYWDFCLQRMDELRRKRLLLSDTDFAKEVERVEAALESKGVPDQERKLLVQCFSLWQSLSNLNRHHYSTHQSYIFSFFA